MILDYRLPDVTGLEIIERVRQSMPEITVVMMTAYGTVESAVQAMKLGAFDYLTKPVNLDELAMVVQKAEIAPIECVARGYLAGSGWKEYQAFLHPGMVCQNR